MKYIKKFNEKITFYGDSHNINKESYEIVQTIDDILLELEDDGKFRISFNRINKMYFVQIRNINRVFNWNDVKEFIYRIKDYLGDRYIRTIVKSPTTYNKYVEVILNEKECIDEVIGIAVEFELNNRFIL